MAYITVTEGTRNDLLQELKARQTEAWENLLMPTKPQKNVDSVLRVPEIYTGRMPDKQSETTKAPYALNSVLNSYYKQEPGDEPEYIANVRTTFCIYNPDGEEGAQMLLNMLERLQISLIKNPVLGDVFELKLDGEGIQSLVYPDDTAPFYMADMVTTWSLPLVKREGWRIWDQH